MENSIFIQRLGVVIYELANAEGRLKSYPDFQMKTQNTFIDRDTHTHTHKGIKRSFISALNLQNIVCGGKTMIMSDLNFLPFQLEETSGCQLCSS